MTEEIRQMAARIRELREICGWSIGDIAKELDIEPSLYEKYETCGEDIPISVLYRLSGLFHVDLNEILLGNSPHLDTYCLVKRGNGMKVDRYPGYSFQSLAYTYKHKIMEPLLVTVEPSDQSPALVTHTGQEFNLCLEGRIEILFDGKVLPLDQGDCIYFNPVHPHGQRAVGGTAKFLTVITQ